MGLVFYFVLCPLHYLICIPSHLAHISFSQSLFRVLLWSSYFFSCDFVRLSDCFYQPTHIFLFILISIFDKLNLLAGLFPFPASFYLDSVLSFFSLMIKCHERVVGDIRPNLLMICSHKASYHVHQSLTINVHLSFADDLYALSLFYVFDEFTNRF